MRDIWPLCRLMALPVVRYRARVAGFGVPARLPTPDARPLHRAQTWRVRENWLLIQRRRPWLSLTFTKATHMARLALVDKFAYGSAERPARDCIGSCSGCIAVACFHYCIKVRKSGVSPLLLYRGL